jgi:hypothetical protein
MRVRTTRTFDGLHRGPKLQTARLDVDILAVRGLNIELDRVARLELYAFRNRRHAKLVRLSVHIVCEKDNATVITAFESSLKVY